MSTYDISNGLITTGLSISGIIIYTFTDISSSDLISISGYISGGTSAVEYSSYTISSIILSSSIWAINSGWDRLLSTYIKGYLTISGGDINLLNGSIYVANTFNNIPVYNIYNNIYNYVYLTYNTISGLTSSGSIYYTSISSNLLPNYINQLNNYNQYIYNYNISLSGLVWSYNKTNQNLLNNYLPLTGGVLNGNLTMNNNIIYLRNNGDTNHYIKYNATLNSWL
jgi:hypothetical protein